MRHLLTLLHDPCIVSFANKTVVIVIGLSHRSNATGFIRFLFWILVGFTQWTCIVLFGFTMTVEIQN